MAAHIARAHTLAVWNRTTARASEFAASSDARVAASPADAAREADIVITCLPTSREVAGLLDGPDGLLAGLRRGALLVDCTSGDPATSRTIAERLAGHGVGFLDAPVSGGRGGAEAGRLTVMVGGRADHLQRAQPVLDCFAAKIVHCGDVGAGDAVKAVNNALLAAHIQATGEGLAALAKAGVDPGIALEVINASSGRSNTSENLFPSRVLNGAWPRTFRLALLDKDVGIAEGIVRETGTPAPLLALTAAFFREARAALGEDADHVEAVRLIEQRAGTEIRSRAQEPA